MPSAHEDVAELPGIRGVDIVWKQSRATVERRPVRVMSFDRSKIGTLHLKATAIIHFIRLDDAGLRIFQRPDHSGQYRGADLQSGRVLAGGERPCLLQG